MQLKLKRSQKETGTFTKSVVFCLDARAELTPEEQANVNKYKLGPQVIYNSEASKQHLQAADSHGASGSLIKGLGRMAMAAMQLNISVNSLQQGQHIECKTLDEVIGCEDALKTACQNLMGYLETAATFDGREAVIDFSKPEPKILTASDPVPTAPLK